MSDSEPVLEQPGNYFAFRVTHRDKFNELDFVIAKPEHIDLVELEYIIAQLQKYIKERLDEQAFMSLVDKIPQTATTPSTGA